MNTSSSSSSPAIEIPETRTLDQVRDALIRLYHHPENALLAPSASSTRVERSDPLMVNDALLPFVVRPVDELALKQVILERDDKASRAAAAYAAASGGGDGGDGDKKKVSFQDKQGMAGTSAAAVKEVLEQQERDKKDGIAPGGPVTGATSLSDWCNALWPSKAELERDREMKEHARKVSMRRGGGGHHEGSGTVFRYGNDPNAAPMLRRFDAIVESGPSCGKTMLAQQICREQPFEGAVAVYLPLQRIVYAKHEVGTMHHLLQLALGGVVTKNPTHREATSVRFDKIDEKDAKDGSDDDDDKNNGFEVEDNWGFGAPSAAAAASRNSSPDSLVNHRIDSLAGFTEQFVVESRFDAALNLVVDCLVEELSRPEHDSSSSREDDDDDDGGDAMGEAMSIAARLAPPPPSADDDQEMGEKNDVEETMQQQQERKKKKEKQKRGSSIPIVWVIDDLDAVDRSTTGRVVNFLQDFVSPVGRNAEFQGVLGSLYETPVRRFDSILCFSRDERRREACNFAHKAQRFILERWNHQRTQEALYQQISLKMSSVFNERVINFGQVKELAGSVCMSPEVFFGNNGPFRGSPYMVDIFSETVVMVAAPNVSAPSSRALTDGFSCPPLSQLSSDLLSFASPLVLFQKFLALRWARFLERSSNRNRLPPFNVVVATAAKLADHMLSHIHTRDLADSLLSFTLDQNEDDYQMQQGGGGAAADEERDQARKRELASAVLGSSDTAWADALVQCGLLHRFERRRETVSVDVASLEQYQLQQKREQEERERRAQERKRNAEEADEDLVLEAATDSECDDDDDDDLVLEFEDSDDSNSNGGAPTSPSKFLKSSDVETHNMFTSENLDAINKLVEKQQQQQQQQSTNNGAVNDKNKSTYSVYCFRHRMELELFAALRYIGTGETDTPPPQVFKEVVNSAALPWHPSHRVVWLALASHCFHVERAKHVGSNGGGSHSDANSSTIYKDWPYTSSLCAAAAHKYYAAYHAHRQKFTDAQIHSLIPSEIDMHQDAISSCLVVEMTKILESRYLLEQVEAAHGWFHRRLPTHFFWMVDQCGRYGLDMTLREILRRVEHNGDKSQREVPIELWARCVRNLQMAPLAASSLPPVMQLVRTAVAKTHDLKEMAKVSAELFVGDKGAMKNMREVLPRRALSPEELERIKREKQAARQAAAERAAAAKKAEEERKAAAAKRAAALAAPVTASTAVAAAAENKKERPLTLLEKAEKKRADQVAAMARRRERTQSQINATMARRKRAATLREQQNESPVEVAPAAAAAASSGADGAGGASSAVATDKLQRDKDAAAHNEKLLRQKKPEQQQQQQQTAARLRSNQQQRSGAQLVSKDLLIAADKLTMEETKQRRALEHVCLATAATQQAVGRFYWKTWVITSVFDRDLWNVGPAHRSGGNDTWFSTFAPVRKVLAEDSVSEVLGLDEQWAHKPASSSLPSSSAPSSAEFSRRISMLEAGVCYANSSDALFMRNEGDNKIRCRLALVEGPPHVGKTTFAQQLCVCQPFFGRVAVYVPFAAVLQRHPQILDSIDKFMQVMTGILSKLDFRIDFAVPFVWVLDDLDCVDRRHDRKLARLLAHFSDAARSSSVMTARAGSSGMDHGGAAASTPRSGGNEPFASGASDGAAASHSYSSVTQHNTASSRPHDLCILVSRDLRENGGCFLHDSGSGHGANGGGSPMEFQVERWYLAPWGPMLTKTLARETWRRLCTPETMPFDDYLTTVQRAAALPAMEHMCQRPKLLSMVCRIVATGQLGSKTPAQQEFLSKMTPVSIFMMDLAERASCGRVPLRQLQTLMANVGPIAVRSVAAGFPWRMTAADAAAEQQQGLDNSSFASSSSASSTSSQQGFTPRAPSISETPRANFDGGKSNNDLQAHFIGANSASSSARTSTGNSHNDPAAAAAAAARRGADGGNINIRSGAGASNNTNNNNAALDEEMESPDWLAHLVILGLVRQELFVTNGSGGGSGTSSGGVKAKTQAGTPFLYTARGGSTMPTPMEGGGPAAAATGYNSGASTPVARYLEQEATHDVFINFARRHDAEYLAAMGLMEHATGFAAAQEAAAAAAKHIEREEAEKAARLKVEEEKETAEKKKREAEKKHQNKSDVKHDDHDSDDDIEIIIDDDSDEEEDHTNKNANSNGNKPKTTEKTSLIASPKTYGAATATSAAAVPSRLPAAPAGAAAGKKGGGLSLASPPPNKRQTALASSSTPSNNNNSSSSSKPSAAPAAASAASPEPTLPQDSIYAAAAAYHAPPALCINLRQSWILASHSSTDKAAFHQLAVESATQSLKSRNPITAMFANVIALELTPALPMLIEHVICPSCANSAPMRQTMVLLSGVFGTEKALEALFVMAKNNAHKGRQYQISLAALCQCFVRAALHGECVSKSGGLLDLLEVYAPRGMLRISLGASAHLGSVPVTRWVMKKKRETLPVGSDADIALARKIARSTGDESVLFAIDSP